MLWKSFAKGSAESYFEVMSDVLHDNSISFQASQDDTRSFYLGSEGPSRIVSITDDLIKAKIVMTSVTGDPIMRFLSGMIGTEKYLKGVCFIEINGLNRNNLKALSKLWNDVVERLGYTVWDLSFHQRFRSSPLLRWQVKSRWHQLLNPK
jgi:hypothetical protein